MKFAGPRLKLRLCNYPIWPQLFNGRIVFECFSKMFFFSAFQWYEQEDAKDQGDLFEGNHTPAVAIQQR